MKLVVMRILYLAWTAFGLCFLWTLEGRAFDAEVRNLTGSNVVCEVGVSRRLFVPGVSSATLPDTNLVFSLGLSTNSWAYAGNVTSLVECYLSNGSLEVAVLECSSSPSPWETWRITFFAGMVVYLGCKTIEAFRRGAREVIE